MSTKPLTSAEILKNIALRCKAISTNNLLQSKAEAGEIVISGIVGDQETPQLKKEPLAHNIEPKNAQEKVLVEVCNMVWGSVPTSLVNSPVLSNLEAILVRRAQLNEMRR